MSDKKKIVIFASGTGSNFVAIYNQIEKGYINGDIVLLISNRLNCTAVDFAKKHNISTAIINKDVINDRTKHQEFLFDKIISVKADLIVLAGYLKMIPEKVILKYKNRILNIHPSLLPKFGGKGYYGMKVHQAVIDSKELFTGATVHFVNAKYDDGPILFQKKIKIENDDTISISEKVLKIEHEILPYTVEAFCDDRIHWKNNKPLIIGT